MKKLALAITLSAAVWVTNPLEALWLVAQGYSCYADSRHGGKGGTTPGWVCEAPKGWKGGYKKNQK